MIIISTTTTRTTTTNTRERFRTFNSGRSSRRSYTGIKNARASAKKLVVVVVVVVVGVEGDVQKRHSPLLVPGEVDCDAPLQSRGEHDAIVKAA